MEEIARNTPELTVQYIDVTSVKDNPNLPVVQQYDVEGTPYFLLYNPEGELEEKGRDVFKRVIKERWGTNSEK